MNTKINFSMRPEISGRTCSKFVQLSHDSLRDSPSSFCTTHSDYGKIHKIINQSKAKDIFWLDASLIKHSATLIRPINTFSKCNCTYSTKFPNCCHNCVKSPLQNYKLGVS